MLVLLDNLRRSFTEARGAWLLSVSLSIALYVGIALAIPIVLARIPADFFARPPRKHALFIHVLRGAVGMIFVAAGIAMLFLPGPGILTIILGLSIAGGEVAARGVRRLIARPSVLSAINAVRAKRGRPPLVPPSLGSPSDPHDSG